MKIQEEARVIKFIEYDSIKFYQDGKGYWLGRYDDKRIRLHIYVWKKFNGPIPKGYHIHHIDHDTNNNELYNLQLMTSHDHLALHGSFESCKANARRCLELSRPKALIWHQSKECKEWAKENYKTSLKKAHDEIVNKVCDCCGQEYITDGSSKFSSRFCSNKCKSKWRRDNHIDDVIKFCIVCGHEFTTTKYKGRNTCNKDCRNKLLLKTRNGIEWQR